MCTFSLTPARIFIRVQHGGQEQGMAAGHHVKGGQRYQILLGSTATVNNFQQVAQRVQKVVISVAISTVEECLLRHWLQKDISDVMLWNKNLAKCI